MIDYILVTQVINYLEESGWTELIDYRWKDNVKTEIQQKFKNINENTLNYILKIVLI